MQPGTLIPKPISELYVSGEKINKTSGDESVATGPLIFVLVFYGCR